jgi:lipopolysaccharide biosynthesis glycosyltransferase
MRLKEVKLGLSFVTYLVMLALITNLWFSIYWYSEDKPFDITPRNPKAFVSLLSLAGHEAPALSSNYTTSLCKLAVSFKANGGHGHDFILLVVGPLSKLADAHMLIRAGWLIVPADGIGQPLMYYYQSNKYSLSQMYSKFQIWRLTSYEHVTYVDSDTIVLRDPMPALNTAYSMVNGDIPGLVIDLGFCIDFYFNAGCMVVRPSIKVYRDLLFYRNWRFYNPGMAEQEFLNVFYKGELVSLPRELNVPAYYYNDSCRFADTTKTVIAHYNGESKPWLTNCTSHPVCRYWHQTPLY